MENDFEKASIRTIAVKANTSKSNIYNYFQNKDDLFCSILKPTMDIIEKATASDAVREIKAKQQKYSLENQKKIIEVIMTFVFKNREDFILLLFKSGGSSYEAFSKNIKSVYADIMRGWLDLNHPQNNVSEFFIESIADFYIHTISQLIIRKPTMAEIDQYFNEFLLFVYGGWDQILKS